MKDGAAESRASDLAAPAAASAPLPRGDVGRRRRRHRARDDVVFVWRMWWVEGGKVSRKRLLSIGLDFCAKFHYPLPLSRGELYRRYCRGHTEKNDATIVKVRNIL